MLYTCSNRHHSNNTGRKIRGSGLGKRESSEDVNLVFAADVFEEVKRFREEFVSHIPQRETGRKGFPSYRTGS